MSRTSLIVAIAALALLTAAPASAGEGDQAARLIAQNMKESGQLKDYRVGVKYQDGVAWLMGSVTSLEQKEIAEQIALETDGVEKVVNKLEVKRDAAPAPSNSKNSVIRTTSAQTPAPAPQRAAARRPGGNMPVPYARTMQGPVQSAGYGEYCGPGAGGPGMGGPMPMTPTAMGAGGGAMGQTVSYDNPQMPGYAWPSYAAYPNYAALTYPQQYSPSAWPYIGPFYPYPQVPLGWRKVTLEWDDGWWFLDFNDCKDCH
jgi:hypothetical protein